MAVTATINVSGIAALRYVLVDTTTFYFTNGVDGQRLLLTLQQDGTGSRTVVSGNCPGIMAPASGANQDTTMTLVYDAVNNTWNGVPQQLAPGGMVLNTTTTNTSLNWTKGLYGISGGSAVTLTITNPVAGPPGVGNDGEIMYFTLLTAQAHVITMATGTTINGSSTTATFTAHIGNALALMALGGKVYIVGANNIGTFAGVVLT
jgi:hypothetical protein